MGTGWRKHGKRKVESREKTRRQRQEIVEERKGRQGSKRKHCTWEMKKRSTEERGKTRSNSSEVVTLPSGRGSWGQMTALWQPASLQSRLNRIIPQWEPQPIMCLESERSQRATDSNESWLYYTEPQRLLMSVCLGSVQLVDTHDRLTD